ncbi:HAD family hydrolase [Rubrivirga marina]|uniref:Haloacid dehalogenase n=1 Tax=Rubrivirga marina TaxID=1196024 RepID=A0A271J4Q2_9BACT|nr:HAD-IA family hydrolase [Rubrivirga marina]PAP78413.1 hypothetical protein BSZ37_19285 [Rubrivirga marina]
MLDLLAFDLDGTLADTESLKGQSYGWAAHQLRPDIDPADVEAAYVPYIGGGRETIAAGLLDHFDLAEAARAHDPSVEPWKSFVTLRLGRYRGMLRDPDLVRRHALPAALAVVETAHRMAHATAIVTTTDRANAWPVLDALGLGDAFDTVVTSDDVEAHKPDPCGYELALGHVGADPARSLAIEDSPTGARAAVAAGLTVLAVPTEFTRAGLLDLVRDGVLPADGLVEPEDLAEAVRRRAEAA